MEGIRIASALAALAMGLVALVAAVAVGRGAEPGQPLEPRSRVTESAWPPVEPAARSIAPDHIVVTRPGVRLGGDLTPEVTRVLQTEGFAAFEDGETSQLAAAIRRVLTAEEVVLVVAEEAP